MQGKCLCGAITITAPDNTVMDVCHCGMCRRWGGGPFMTVHGGPEVRIEGREKLKTYQSSAWAQRGFCGECGTHLYYHLLPANAHILSAGLFQDQAGFDFRRQIFIDSKPGHYEFANATETLTEAEVLAKYA